MGSPPWGSSAVAVPSHNDPTVRYGIASELGRRSLTVQRCSFSLSTTWMSAGVPRSVVSAAAAGTCRKPAERRPAIVATRAIFGCAFRGFIYVFYFLNYIVHIDRLPAAGYPRWPSVVGYRLFTLIVKIAQSDVLYVLGFGNWLRYSGDGVICQPSPSRLSPTSIEPQMRGARRPRANPGAGRVRERLRSVRNTSTDNPSSLDPEGPDGTPDRPPLHIR